MFTKSFWLDTAERAAKTFAQVLLAVFAISGVTVLNADWPTALATAGTAVLASFLTSILSAAKSSAVDGEEPVKTASLVSGVTYDEKAV